MIRSLVKKLSVIEKHSTHISKCKIVNTRKKFPSYKKAFTFFSPQVASLRYYTQESKKEENNNTEEEYNQLKEKYASLEKEVNEAKQELAKIKQDILFSYAERENIRRQANVEIKRIKDEGNKKFGMEMKEVIEELENVIKQIPEDKLDEDKDLAIAYEGLVSTKKIFEKVVSDHYKEE